MSTIETEVPTLVVTNPLWLWAFRHAVEDQGWGSRPIDQHVLAVIIHELAGKISDEEIGAEIKRSAAKFILDTAQSVINK